MKNKCTVIQISGLRGLLIVGFIIMCAVSGFILFPAWCCMKTWNFIAGHVVNMPVMALKHGAILWLIVVLTAYATLANKFRIAFVSRSAALNDEELKNDPEVLRALSADIIKKSEEASEQEELKK